MRMTKAWETRRRKYGPKGHASPYYRSQREADKVALERCRVLIARLHNEGILSEGQASRATGLDRVSLRALCDDLAEREISRQSDGEKLAEQITEAWNEKYGTRPSDKGENE